MTQLSKVTTGRGGRLPELDVLRFLAACSVVAYHYTYRATLSGRENGSAFPAIEHISRFGYLGVTLFFMISGFVILWSSQARSASEFVVSRIARLFPSFWICVLLTTLAVGMSGEPPIPLRTVGLNLTMVPGVLGAPYVDGVYWTLFVELKFYALVYAVLLTGTMTKVEAWLVAWLTASIIAAAGIGPKLLSSVILYPYGPYFISGCVLFLVRTRGISALRLATLIIACALGARYAIYQQSGFMHVSPASGAIVASLVVVFHAIMLLVAVRPSVLPQSTWWYWFGGFTYPLYLLHNRIGRLIWNATSSVISPMLIVGLELLVAFSLSAIIASTIERKACNRFNRKLLDVGTRLGVVRSTRPAATAIT